MKVLEYKEDKNIKLPFVLVSIVIYTISLFVMNYFKFDLLNISWYVGSVALLIAVGYNPHPIKQWIVYQLLATFSLIVAFYSYCYAMIPNTLYLYILGGYVIVSIIFGLNELIMICLLIELISLLITGRRIYDHIGLYTNFIYIVLGSFYNKNIILKKLIKQ